MFWNVVCLTIYCKIFNYGGNNDNQSINLLNKHKIRQYLFYFTLYLTVSSPTGRACCSSFKLSALCSFCVLYLIYHLPILFYLIVPDQGYSINKCLLRNKADNYISIDLLNDSLIISTFYFSVSNRLLTNMIFQSNNNI